MEGEAGGTNQVPVFSRIQLFCVSESIWEVCFSIKQLKEILEKPVFFMKPLRLHL